NHEWSTRGADATSTTSSRVTRTVAADNGRNHIGDCAGDQYGADHLPARHADICPDDTDRAREHCHRCATVSAGHALLLPAWPVAPARPAGAAKSMSGCNGAHQSIHGILKISSRMRHATTEWPNPDRPSVWRLLFDGTLVRRADHRRRDARRGS